MPVTRQDLERIKATAGCPGPGRVVTGNWIRVGCSTCGIAAGAEAVYQELAEEIKARGLDVQVKRCGCVGMCSAEPLVEVNVEGAPRVFYGKVNKDVALKIVEEHVVQKKLVENHIYEL